MKVLEKITGLTAASILIVMGSSAGYAQGSLSELLNAVENDRVAESEEYQQRLQEFEQNAARQTEILELPRAESLSKKLCKFSSATSLKRTR